MTGVIEARGPHVYIRLLELADEAAVVALRRRNAQFLEPWEPQRPPGYLEAETQRAHLRKAAADSNADRAYSFGIFTHDDEIVGTLNLSNVARGAWQNATIGYFVDEVHNGKGFATEAIQLAVELAFTELRLHRVQAAVMPRNPASIRALEKAGFRKEGESLRYLQITGRWEDHLILAITTEDLGL